MPLRSIPDAATALRSKPVPARAALGVLALALLLGGCDRCGDWLGFPRSQGAGLDACRQQVPSPQPQ